MIASTLDDVKTWVDIAGTFVTAAAVVIGGVWAYFRFVRNRTYRPRLEIEMEARRHDVGTPLVEANVTVKNIGASDVRLRQHGTGLRVSRIEDPIPADGIVHWKSLGVFSILKEHAWIEPSESVTESMLLSLPLTSHDPLLFEARLVWTWGRHESPIVVFARQVMSSDHPSEVSLQKGEAT
jgi:hypothetical protein